MKIRADDMYLFQAILKEFIISNTPGKFGEKILNLYGTVQLFHSSSAYRF